MARKNARAAQSSSTRRSNRFKKLPKSLEPFVKHLDPEGVYILNLDTEDRIVKLHAFVVPMFLNLAIVGLLLYRVYRGFFTYPQMFDALFNQNSPARQFPDGATNITRITIIIGRSWNLLFDWLLVNWLAPWPVRFFFEGPLTWRREVGILTTEVVVRRDRGWPTVVDSEKWYEEESNFAIDNVIMPAIAADRLGKTGSLLVDSNWNVEYQAMIEAHNLIRNRKAHFEDFKTACLVNHAGASRVWDKLRKKGKGRARNETTDPSPGDDEAWLIWRVDPFDEEEDYKDPSQREKIDQIEGALKEMGKEDLFFRWVELMQYEMSSPGGWTVEKQQVCERKTKELFESEHVDFEEFWKKIGGMEGVSK